MDYVPSLHHSLPLRTRRDGGRYWRAADLRLPVSAATGPVVLASMSPRRRELLRRAGIRFIICDPGEDPPLPHLDDWPAACLRAVHKAARGAQAWPGRLSLGADTEVVYAGRTLGKPADEQEARQMLERLSGQTHHVYTAFCLAVGSTGFPACAERRRERAGLEAYATRVVWLEVVRTAVRFRSLSPEEISAYVAGGAPRDKAGAYGIQDRGPRLVESIRGSYYNVVGLPVRQVEAALRAVGWRGPSG